MKFDSILICLLCVIIGFFAGRAYQEIQFKQKLNKISDETRQQFISHLDSLRADLQFIGNDSARQARYEQERKWFEEYIRTRLRD